MPPELTCAAVREQLGGYVLGALEPAEADAVPRTSPRARRAPPSTPPRRAAGLLDLAEGLAHPTSRLAARWRRRCSTASPGAREAAGRRVRGRRLRACGRLDAPAGRAGARRARRRAGGRALGARPRRRTEATPASIVLRCSRDRPRRTRRRRSRSTASRAAPACSCGPTACRPGSRRSTRCSASARLERERGHVPRRRARRVRARSRPRRGSASTSASASARVVTKDRAATSTTDVLTGRLCSDRGDPCEADPDRGDRRARVRRLRRRRGARERRPRQRPLDLEASASGGRTSRSRPTRAARSSSTRRR